MRALSENALATTWHNRLPMRFFSGRIVGGTQLKQEELAEVFGASENSNQRGITGIRGAGIDCPPATRRIYAVELSEEQIQIIYEMIGDILKKAVENLKNEDKGKEVITILPLIYPHRNVLMRYY